MARLIDADALMDVIRQHEYRLATRQGSIDYGMFTLGIQQAVDEQLTVDAVPVVRCKDCAVPHNKYTGCPELKGLVTPPDFYCPFGERKDGDD